MQFDFTSTMDRHNKDAIAVDAPYSEDRGFAPAPPKKGFDLIPMWVADMNFPTAPSITDAIAARVQHPAFGYFFPTDAYYDAIIDWQNRRNGVSGLAKEHIGYENGVLGGLVSALSAFAAPGDAVLLHSPTYIGFTGCIEAAGYRIVHSPLVKDADGIWRMDYEDMDRKLAQNKIHVAVFCSPHNPCGRVWERWEIERAMDVYANNDCVVIADEIWSDLTLGNYRHIPTQSVSDDAKNRTVALYAPSKTFNLAGLIGSYHIIYNNYLRDRVVAQSEKCHYNSMNVLSMHALIGAYTETGHQWVDELRQVLTSNVDFACSYLEEHFPEVEFAKPQGTYMLFLNFTKWCEKHDMAFEDVLQGGWDVGVAWQDGRPFHGGNCIRMNLALPLSRVQEAFDRLNEYALK